MLPTQDQEKTQYLWDKGVGDEELQNAHTGQDYELTLHGNRDIIPQPSLGDHKCNPPLERSLSYQS